MAPTRIYVKSILALLADTPVKAIAHITGGGLPGNLPRVMPQDTVAHIDTGSWQWPEVFQWLQQNGNIETSEMYRTFNCGVGMVLAVAATNADKALATLRAQGETAWFIGEIKSGSGEPRVDFD